MSISNRIVLAVFLALAAAPAAAGERVYLLRTQEDASVAAPTCAPGENLKLGALVYAPRSSKRTGYVWRDTGRPIGSAVACGTIRSYSPFDPEAQNSFSITFSLEDGTVSASGVCTLASLTFPVQGLPAPLMLVGCTLKVAPDAAQGILNGVATSASVFTPVALPGYQTGSYWTVQLYVDDAVFGRHGRGHGGERDDD